MITDERFDKLVERALIVAKGTPEGCFNTVFSTMMHHLVINESNGNGMSSLTAMNARRTTKAKVSAGKKGGSR